MFHRSAGAVRRPHDAIAVVYQRQRHTLTHVVTSRRLIDRSNSPPGATRDRHAPTPVQRTTEEDAHAAPRCWFLLPVLQTQLCKVPFYVTCPCSVPSKGPSRQAHMPPAEAQLAAFRHIPAEGVLIASPPPRPSPPSRLSPLGCWSSLRLARPRRRCGADCQP